MAANATLNIRFWTKAPKMDSGNCRSPAIKNSGIPDKTLIIQYFLNSKITGRTKRIWEFYNFGINSANFALPEARNEPWKFKEPEKSTIHERTLEWTMEIQNHVILVWTYSISELRDPRTLTWFWEFCNFRIPESVNGLRYSKIRKKKLMELRKSVKFCVLATRAPQGPLIVNR